MVILFLFLFELLFFENRNLGCFTQKETKAPLFNLFEINTMNRVINFSNDNYLKIQQETIWNENDTNSVIETILHIENISTENVTLLIDNEKCSLNCKTIDNDHLQANLSLKATRYDFEEIEIPSMLELVANQTYKKNIKYSIPSFLTKTNIQIFIKVAYINEKTLKTYSLLNNQGETTKAIEAIDRNEIIMNCNSFNLLFDIPAFK